MKERCTNTSKDFWKKIHKLPETQETKPVTKLQKASKQENAKTKFFKTKFPFFTNSGTQNDHSLEDLENMGG
jgi:hypothetical protein